jgi:hypothetical protein
LVQGWRPGQETQGFFTLGLPLVVVLWAESPGNNRHFLTFVRLDHTEKVPSNCSNKKGGRQGFLAHPLIFGQVSDTRSGSCAKLPPNPPDSTRTIYRPPGWQHGHSDLTCGLALVPQVAEEHDWIDFKLASGDGRSVYLALGKDCLPSMSSTFYDTTRTRYRGGDGAAFLPRKKRGCCSSRW